MDREKKVIIAFLPMRFLLYSIWILSRALEPETARSFTVQMFCCSII